MQTVWDARAHENSTGTVADRVAARSGVAVLKVDEDVKFWTRSATGAGFQVEGYRGYGNQIGVCRGLIVKAKLGDRYVCPRQLTGMKIFYRFYLEIDKNGIRRPYLYLAARPGDAPYQGTRCVIIANNGAFLAPDRALKLKLTDRVWPPMEDESPLSLGEKIQADYDRKAVH